MRATAALLVLILLVAAGANARDKARERAAQEKQLLELKQDLDERRAALKDLDNKERSLITTLSELDRSLAALVEVQEGARSREERLKAEMTRLRAALERDRAVYEQTSARLEKRLRALYVLGNGGALLHLIGADSFEDLSYRRRLLSTLAESDARLVERHARVFREVEAKATRLAAAVEDAKETRRQIAEQADILSATRKERAAAIGRIDREKELAVRAVKENVAAQREARALLRKLAPRRKRARKSTVGVLKDGLAWPVKGRVLRTFGTVKEKKTGARITSNGIHIQAKLGTPVGAPADARVVHAGWLRGFGRIVILDHGDGVHSLLAHLSRFAVGAADNVVRGQTVGFVGDTESLDGSKLYFELRRAGRPQNPTPYLD